MSDLGLVVKGSKLHQLSQRNVPQNLGTVSLYERQLDKCSLQRRDRSVLVATFDEAKSPRSKHTT
jgi:hypothetical protein